MPKRHALTRTPPAPRPGPKGIRWAPERFARVERAAAMLDLTGAELVRLASEAAAELVLEADGRPVPRWLERAVANRQAGS